jgi:hypothetical protein
MTKVRLLAPYTDDKGEPHAAGAVIDVSDEQATALNNRGAASKLDEEKALEDQAATSAVYNARLQRADAPTPPAEVKPASKEAPNRRQ